MLRALIVLRRLSWCYYKHMHGIACSPATNSMPTKPDERLFWIPLCADGADDDTGDEGAAAAVAEADNADTLAVQN